MAGLKHESKNLIEKALPDIRVRTSKLPEIARYESFGTVYAHVLYLRDKFGELADDLYQVEMQEVICFDGTNKNKD